MVSDDKIHEEIIKEAIEDTSEDRHSSVYKVFFAVLSLTVIVAMLIAFLGGGQSIHYIQGRLASSTISDSFSITLDDGKEVFLPKDVYYGLVGLLTEENKEFKACLIGKKDENRYIITEFYVPKIYRRTYRSVTSEQCSPDTIIPLHSHPIEHCVFSEQDIKSYESFKKVNTDALLGLMCGLDRFSFYGE